MESRVSHRRRIGQVSRSKKRQEESRAVVGASPLSIAPPSPSEPPSPAAPDPVDWTMAWQSAPLLIPTDNPESAPDSAYPSPILSPNLPSSSAFLDMPPSPYVSPSPLDLPSFLSLMPVDDCDAPSQFFDYDPSFDPVAFPPYPDPDPDASPIAAAIPLLDTAAHHHCPMHGALWSAHEEFVPDPAGFVEDAMKKVLSGPPPHPPRKRE
ncbi:hypothetical protein BDK51DRAFT_38805 [Blyttiomyces helicus]|uniref:Uncharacterized protein n=1 Tax=Blyttiomyces helicus TaxID=388810 RepID=A0A4P9W883_9FUNG|nr:hypothetical protein BDK51DRAFT_38805 [Blyttiomyces helicus]|eukprot:RKO87653.1 hypothetical protein BDK51DRAFT_38805 [Blyttiomyces helicus]